MPRVLPVAAVLLVLSAGATTGPTTAPTTEPTTAPTTEPVRDAWVRDAFDRLADPDSPVRVAARRDLMGLSRADLPRLLAVARAAALRRVVRQVFLAADRYDGDRGGHRTLGLRWPDEAVAATYPSGVPVAERLAGFPAARWLRDGDRITAAAAGPVDLPVERWPTRPVHSVADVDLTVFLAAAGNIVLTARRGDGDVRVVVPVVPQPAEIVSDEPGAAVAFVKGRDDRADAFWRAAFAPLVRASDRRPPRAAATRPTPGGRARP